MLAADAETGLRGAGPGSARPMPAQGAGDITGAVQIYDLLAGDSRVDPLYRDLGALLAAQRLVDRANVSEINQRLAPLLAGHSPWRPLAAELSAIAEMRAGNTDGIAGALRGARQRSGRAGRPAPAGGGAAGEPRRRPGGGARGRQRVPRLG